MITRTNTWKIVKEFFGPENEDYLDKIIDDDHFVDSLMRCKTKAEVESVCLNYC